MPAIPPLRALSPHPCLRRTALGLAFATLLPLAPVQAAPIALLSASLDTAFSLDGFSTGAANQFTLSLAAASGSLAFNRPADGLYGVTANGNVTLASDAAYSDVLLNRSYVNQNLFFGQIATGDVGSQSVSFDFTNGLYTRDGVTTANGASGSFTTSYNGFANFISGLAGGPALAPGSGSGTLSVSYTIDAAKNASFTITDTPVTENGWQGFEQYIRDWQANRGNSGDHVDGYVRNTSAFTLTATAAQAGDGSSPLTPLLPTSTDPQTVTVQTPDGPVQTTTSEYSFAPQSITPGQRVSYDPFYASGYVYEISNAAGPKLAALFLPVVGDNEYLLEYSSDGGTSWSLASWVGSNGTVFGNVLYSLLNATLAPTGLSMLRLTGIETSAMIDPNDPLGFVTTFGYAQAGTQGLTMTAIPDFVADATAIPAPAPLALIGLGLTALALGRRRLKVA